MTERVVAATSGPECPVRPRDTAVYDQVAPMREGRQEEDMKGSSSHEEVEEEGQIRRGTDEDEGEVIPEKEEEEEGRVERKVRTLRKVGSPSQEEYDQHQLLHGEFRSWCPACVEGRGRPRQHRRNVDEEDEEPVVVMDFASMAAEGWLRTGREEDNEEEDEEEGEDEGDWYPKSGRIKMVVMKDKKYKTYVCTQYPPKALSTSKPRRG